MKLALKMTCVAVTCALLAGCTTSDTGDDYAAELQEHRDSATIEKVRIIISGETGNNMVTEKYEIQNLPLSSDETGIQWAMVVQGMAGNYLTYYNIAARTERRVDTWESSSYSYAGASSRLPTDRAWKQWYWSVLQDSLLRLDACGYKAKVEFLNSYGQPLDTLMTESSSPEPALQSATTPAQYIQKSRDVIEAASPRSA